MVVRILAATMATIVWLFAWFATAVYIISRIIHLETWWAFPFYMAFILPWMVVGIGVLRYGWWLLVLRHSTGAK